MTKFVDLSESKKDLVLRLFTAIVRKNTSNDITGHLLNCGYTDEKPTCECSSYGKTLHQIIVDEVDR